MMAGESDQELVDRAIAVATRHDTDFQEWRRGGLGASDIAGILGLSPWSSPWSVWARKVGLTEDRDDEQTEAMEFGLMAEGMLAAYFERRTGLAVEGEQTRCQRPDHPWMRCTVDGFAYETHRPDVWRDRSSALAVVEFKTTADAPALWTPDVPVHYACQATWTAIVTGFPVVSFGVLHLAFGRPRFRVYDFRPNEVDIATVTARAEQFWNEHVLTGTPPVSDGSQATTNALLDVYRGDVELDAVEADASIIRAARHIAANQERIDACQAIIDEQKNAIRVAMGDHTTLTAGVDDNGRPRVLATWKDQHRRAYTVEESTSRVLRVNTGVVKT